MNGTRRKLIHRILHPRTGDRWACRWPNGVLYRSLILVANWKRIRFMRTKSGHTTSIVEVSPAEFRQLAEVTLRHTSSFYPAKRQ